MHLEAAFPPLDYSSSGRGRAPVGFEGPASHCSRAAEPGDRRCLKGLPGEGNCRREAVSPTDTHRLDLVGALTLHANQPLCSSWHPHQIPLSSPR